MFEEIFPVIIIVLVFALIILFGFLVARGFSRRSNLTIVYGATSDMYTKDKKYSMEYIIENQAKKKMEEQESGEKEI